MQLQFWCLIIVIYQNAFIVLFKLYFKVIVLEASNRLGGFVDTLKLEDGSLFERGPRSIRGVGKSGYNTIELVSLPFLFIYLNCLLYANSVCLNMSECESYES